ncbi:type I restriction enzyme HsdR N-terminal domain-containing protein [Gilliamella mensalis]|uniref:type I restriction enzyme HsdR N-terminal domain-containing protein n=1 Tax=Gilliamella mensalis TaxID=1908520 RepID=UPI000A14AE9D|nr:type I restriction enzyme HsdR N-terminal domain-containing protein [Gilliamella mensalis]
MTGADLNMSNLNFDKNSTESDVEQLFMINFLKAPKPYGLGLSNSNILTKHNINKYSIGKGNSAKIYYPDYLLVNGGYPIVVIEVKKPSDTNLDEAFREARLYAHEVNDKFDRELNPVNYILASNGIDLMFGAVGSDTPIITCKVNQLIYGSQNLNILIETIGEMGLNSCIKKISQKIKPPYIQKPRKTIGGKTTQEEEIKKNPLGENISDTYRWIFDPFTEDHRKYIVTKGYINTDINKKTQHEIDRVVRMSNSASELISQQIQQTNKPVEIFEVLSKNSYSQIILLIGKVGVGKSTFIDLLQYTDTIPEKIQDSLIWVRLDLNNAPLDKEKIYTWVQKEIIENLQKQFSSEYDFDSLDFLMKLYSVEVNSFKKGRGAILSEDTESYKKSLFDLLENSQNNLDLTLKCYIRHLANERAKSMIIVFDNCDKKDKDSQLLMFEVANWAKDSLKSIIFLPLRDETYDNYKDQKPLDTAIKQYSFRIDAPKFQTVLTRRVQMALELIFDSNSVNSKNSDFILKNSMHVKFDPNSDGSVYLLCMLNSVLNNENSIRRLLTGLSGGNIRIALEMFLNFCSSGHIPNEEIVKIRKFNNSSYTMPEHVAIRALMRGNHRYYISKYSKIKNLLDAQITDENIPIYLIRLAILRWLKLMIKKRDSKKNFRKGYFLVKDIIADLDNIGFSESLVLNQITYLAHAMCIVSEDFQCENITLNTNVKLAPAGYAHLELLENDITYLATVSEDTLITDKKLVTDIKNVMINPKNTYKLAKVCKTACRFVEYIEKISLKMLTDNQVFSTSELLPQLISMEKPRLTIDRFKRMLDSDDDWKDFCKKYPIGTKLKGVIKNKAPFGIFVALDTNDKFSIDGLIHKSNIPKEQLNKFSSRQNIDVIIQYHDPETPKKVSLIFC